MKKHLAVLVVALAVAACGGGGGSDEAVSTTTTSAVDPSAVEAVLDGIATSWTSRFGVAGERAGSNTIASVASQWELDASDAEAAAEELEVLLSSLPSLKAHVPLLRRFAAAERAVGSCVRSIDPDFFVSSVERQCPAPFAEYEARVRRWLDADDAIRRHFGLQTLDDVLDEIGG